MILSDAQKIEFANCLLGQFEITPLSTLPKSEIELLFFRAYLNAGYFSLENSDFDIGKLLRIQSTKVSALRYRYRLSRPQNDDFLSALSNEILLLGVEKESNLLKLSIADSYFRDMFISELRKQGAASDGSFSKSIIRVNVELARICIEGMAGDRSQELASSIEKALRLRKVQDFKTGLVEFLSSATAGTLANFLSN